MKKTNGKRPLNQRREPQKSLPNNKNSMRNGEDPWKVHQKYLAQARDAASSGNIIDAEAFYQHAEHYYRLALAQQQSALVAQTIHGDDLPLPPPIVETRSNTTPQK